ncbi:MAG: T9SS type A sorting domain-containing protein [Bacteroidetes bacterium]|nr:T9SS type A sorting domain-containing protein [Bacteroidota bacterium]
MNSDSNSIIITLLYTLEKSGSGLIAEGSSDSISLAPGTRTITYDDVNSENSSTIFDRWGNLKTGSGDYIISIQIFNSSGAEIGSDSISQRVEIQPFDILEVALNKTSLSDSTFYQLIITNNYDGELEDNKPKSFRITVGSDSILSISGGVSVGWERTPSKFPPGSNSIIWTNSSGEIPSDSTYLGNIYFDNLESVPISLTYEWRNKSDDIIYTKSVILGQADACITWDLLSDESVTTTAGNILGVPESIGVGPAPTMSVFNYNSNGQRLWVGNTGWIAGSLDLTRYIEFNTSPVSGNNLNVTNVSFNYGDNQIATDFFIINSQVFYSIDNWATSTALSQSALLYLNSSMSTFSASNLNIAVSYGQTFSLRIYPYAVKNGSAMTPTFVIHNDVKICGITTPQVVTDGSICGIKFNDLNGNGIMDLNEPGLPNWTIQLTGAASRTTVTNFDGTYCFNRLKAGDYNVAEVNQTGWTQKMPSAPGTYSVSLTSGQELENINFGNKYDPDAGCSKVWEALGSGMNDEVFAYAKNGNIIYAGGDFTTADGVSANYIAKWDGTNWTPLGTGLNGKVRAIAVMGSDVYVGGMFTMAGGVSANRIAKWNGTSWSALGSGVNGSVDALKFLGNDLYVGGSFTSAGGISTNCLAKWDGANWSSPGGGVYDFGDYMSVRALAVIGSDLYVGGRYYSLNGYSYGFTSKWDGTNWSNQTTFGGYVDALAVIGSDLYVGGWFYNRIRKWDGTTWTTPGGGMNNHIHALAVIGSDLYAGGAFTTAGGVSAYRVAKYNGTAWSALGTGVSNWSGSHGHVEALLADGNELYAGGGFDIAGTVNANYAAKYLCSESITLNVFVLGNVFHDINVNGVFDDEEPVLTNWTVNISGAAVGTSHTNSDGNFYFNNLKPGVYTVAVKFPTGWTGSGSPTGSYTFDAAPGQTITGFHLAVKPIDCENVLKEWSALGRGTGAQVSAILQMGNDIYAGGAFTDAGGTTANHIAKWDGTVWSPLGSGINGDINALAVLGTDLYAGGSFTTAGEVSASSIAKWDGTNWSALGSGINDTVKSLVVINDELYAAGNFKDIGGITANNIAKWDGSSWSTLGNGLNIDIRSLAVIGSDLYAGGKKKDYDWDEAAGDLKNIAKWDGSSWSTLGNGSNIDISTLVVIGSDLYVGGQKKKKDKDWDEAVGDLKNIAKWDGISWSTLGNGLNIDINTLAVFGSDLYAGGLKKKKDKDWDEAAGDLNNIAIWDGTNWSALGTGMNQNYVQTITAVGGDLYAGGLFNTADGISALNIAKYSCNTVTSVEDTYENNLPRTFKLEQNYPNPFNPSSTIKYDIPKNSFVKIIVYDILGREIKILLNEEKSPGSYEINFDAKYLASGIYFYTINAGEFYQSKKMILLK